MEYCHTHDYHYDTDFELCGECEQELTESLDTFRYLVQKITHEKPSVQAEDGFCDFSEEVRAEIIRALYIALKEQTVAAK
jgi:hypothetical protein